MRPRPEGRGEPPSTSSSASRRPRFNAATTRRPWRTYYKRGSGRYSLSLQCGHDPKAVENPGVPDADAEAAEASMRPRPEGRGEPDAVSDWIKEAAEASMRPRPEGRGERADRPRQVGAVNRLQCGHDPKAVENHGRSRHRRQNTGGFNAATTRRPWRTAGTLCLVVNDVALQCGHDPKAVENLGISGTGRQDKTPCFNAATTRRPWRTPPDQRPCTVRSYRLQCGHDPKAVENPKRGPSCPNCWRGASMRPRPEGRGELAGSI